MTTITLEIPDDLAAQFEIDSGRLSALIREVLDARVAQRPSPRSQDRSPAPAYQEMLDFLTSGPTQQQIVSFKISTAAQERLEELLDRNREENLTQDERTELETYLQFSHLLTRIKARARDSHPFPS